MKNSKSSFEEGGGEEEWPVKLSAFEVRPTVATLVPAVASSDGQEDLEELERENSLLRAVLREARGGLGDCSKQVGVIPAVLRAAARSRQGRDKCDRQVHAAWLIRDTREVFILSQFLHTNRHMSQKYDFIPFIACPI